MEREIYNFRAEQNTGKKHQDLLKRMQKIKKILSMRDKLIEIKVRIWNLEKKERKRIGTYFLSA